MSDDKRYDSVPCEDCGGSGCILYSIDNSVIDFVDCETCDGKGVEFVTQNI